MRAEMREALEERSALIEARASAVLDEALMAGDAWTRELGADTRRSLTPHWRLYACSVAAYRDRYAIEGASVLGPAPQTLAQQYDAARARTALNAAKRLAGGRDTFAIPGPGVAMGHPAVHIQI
jgi:hypothetical protein